MHRGILIIGSLLSALAVALGAFGAHGLENLLSYDELRSYRTGIQYHFYHTGALLITGLLWRKIPVSAVLWSSRFFTLGVALFSGSLYTITYMKTMAVTAPTWFFFLTPIGGVCFILGWFVLGWGINKGKGKEWTKKE
jgi:uncharacterized membrane protein YgdD (TMEM256/DUF423 family)